MKDLLEIREEIDRIDGQMIELGSLTVEYSKKLSQVA